MKFERGGVVLLSNGKLVNIQNESNSVTSENIKSTTLFIGYADNSF